MAEKNLKARIVHKHDTEANWLLATGFTPKQGEIIVYDIDSDHSYERIKIGDGVQNVNDLPFYNDGFVSYNEQTLTNEQKAQARANIDAVANNDMCIIPIENIVDFGGEHTIKIEGDENTFYGGPICTRKINLDYSFAGCPSHIFMSKLPDGCAVQQFWLNFKKPDGSTTLCSFIPGVSTTEYFIFSVYPKGKNIVIYTLLANSQTVITYDDNGDYVSSFVNSNIDSNNLINKLNSLLSSSSYVPSADADVTTKKYVDDALAIKADQTALDEVSALVGDTAVSEQIDAAIAEIPQADWSQNDESAADYIKNRPFYENCIPLAIVESTGHASGFLTHKVGPYTWDYDKAITVRVDGVTYAFDEFAYSGYSSNLGCNVYKIGAPYEKGQVSDSSEYPFTIIVFKKDEEYAHIAFADGTANHTVEIFEGIKQLDPKYIKDIYYEEENVTDITGLSFSHSDFVFDFFPSEHNLNIPLALGQVWEMRYINHTGGNNIESSYEGLEVKEAEDGTLYIGTYPDVNDLPFYITNNTDCVNSGWWRITNPTDISVTCISGTVVGEPIVHHLDPKYIKDMYYETPEVWTSLDIINNDNEHFYLDYTLELDKPYTVCVDGIVYSFDSLERGGYNSTSGYYSWYLGAQIDSGVYVQTWDYPFTIWSMGYDGPKTETRVRFEDGAVDHTIEVLESESVIHHLDPKYIKDMYHEEPVELFSIENAEFVDNAYMVETPFAIVDGHTYIVNWDGVEYTCEAYIFEGIHAIGNTTEFGGKGNGEPFVIGYDSLDNVSFVNIFDDLTTHTFSVTEMVRHTIPPKYIKDMYYEEENLVNIAGLEYFVINPMSNGVTEYTYDYIPLELGQTWDVCYNPSNNSNFTAGDYSSMPVQEDEDGNLYIGDPEVNTYPFYITNNFIRVNANWYSIIRMTVVKIVGVSGTYTDDPIVHQIDAKYLPILEEAQETIIETEVTDFIELIGPEYGKLLGKYNVVIDGVSETVEFIDDGMGSFVETESFFIESWTDPEGYVDNNGFVMGFVNQDGNSHSVEILAIKDIIKEEYLPESVTAKPDWEQGDPNGAGYIENRTHYEEKNIIIDTEVDVTTEAKVKGYTTRAYYRFNKLLDYKDARVRVVYDGIEYDCELKRSGDSINGEVDGHGCHIGDENLIEYPFYVFFHYEWNVVGTTTPGTHRFEISDVKIHHLDPKYIKDMYYETEPVETELVPETTLDCTSTTQVNNPFTIDLVGGQTYLVVWNGIEYECIAKVVDSEGFAYIGNASILGGDDSGEPFLCASMDGDVVLVVVENGTYTISISAITMPVIYQIDPKYISDSIARTEDVDALHALVGDTPVAEQINNAIVIATDDEIIELLAQEDMLPVVKDSDGSFLADENENILLW